MGLAEALAARLQGQGRTAQVTCGQLGSVTVEALPLRELEQLLRGADGPRAVFYAACRELQKAGEEFRKAGKFYTPDQIVQFVSESEAQAAAQAVLSLSGWDNKKMPKVRLSSAQETTEETAPKAEAEPEEVRPSSVRDEPPLFPVPQDTPAAVPAETRPEPVQLPSADIQPSPAGIDSAGQVSHETAEAAEDINENPLVDKKAQTLDELTPERAKNVVPSRVNFSVATPNDDRATEPLHEIAPENPQDAEVPLHEIESDFGEEQAIPLHETASDLNAEQAMPLGEIKSDFDVEQAVPLREIKSDFPQSAGEGLHESKSAFPEVPHETASELPKSLREAMPELSKSVQESETESAENLRETASEPAKKTYETEPDSAERLAKALLDGLRRAKWVRGG